MKNLKNSLAVAVALTCVLTAAAGARQIEDKEPINLELKAAPLAETLQSFAALNSSELRLADGVEGSVTMTFENTPWNEVLAAVCKENGLTCELLQRADAEPPVLRADRAADRDLPPGFPEPINLSLRNADLVETLKVFEAISGWDVRTPDDVAGSVTLHVVRTPWPIALQEVCYLNGYRAVWGDGTIEIVPHESPRGSLINMSLNDGAFDEVVHVFGEIVSDLGGFGQVRVDVAPELQDTKVSVELHMVGYLEALTLLCRDAGCAWQITYGEPSVLDVRPLDQAESKTTAMGHKPGAAPSDLAVRFTPLSGGAVDGAARLGWGSPSQVFKSSDDTQLALFWMSFGPGLTAVVPVLQRCEGTLAGSTVLEPAILPFEEKRYTTTGGELVLRHGAGPSGKSAAELALEPCRDAGGDVLRVMVQEIDAEGRVPAGEREFRVERLALLTPVGADRPAAAVLGLHLDADDGRHVAVLRPDVENGTVTVEHAVLQREVPHRIEVSSGERYALTLVYGADPWTRAQ